MVGGRHNWGARRCAWRVPEITAFTAGILLAATAAWGQQSTIPAMVVPRQADRLHPLVVDNVNVVDVERGKLIRDQRVVIVGNRIGAMGRVGTVRMPKSARVVQARGKYLIPGLWDMHTHSITGTDLVIRRAPQLIDLFYPLFVTNGVTGIRDAASAMPLDTLIRWRREILAGARVGPPRQVLSGKAIDAMPFRAIGGMPYCLGSSDSIAPPHVCAADAAGARRLVDSLTAAGVDMFRMYNRMPYCLGFPDSVAPHHVCVVDAAEARRLVDSLKAAGADMIKTYNLSPAMYSVVAAEARRIGVRFGGHSPPLPMSQTEASDSGASVLDHDDQMQILDHCWPRLSLSDFKKQIPRSWDPVDSATVETCRQLADRFSRNGTWWAPTLMAGFFVGPGSDSIRTRFHEASRQFWAGRVLNFYATGRVPPTGTGGDTAHVLRTPLPPDSDGMLRLAQRAGLPILAGVDATVWSMGMIAPGFALHAELALLVREGLTPLDALRAATLNPAKMLHGTDSLGTVARGKLADLVLLDANPLADITNTTTIRGVVADGRYYDRAALDRLLMAVQASAARTPLPTLP